MKKSKFLQNPFSFIQINFILLGVIALRVFLEEIFLKHGLGNPIPLQGRLFLYLENTYYYFIIFYFFSNLLSSLCKKTLLETVNLSIKVVPIIALTPILDHFLFGRLAGYSYCTAQNYLSNTLTLGLQTGDPGWGLTTEILILLILITGYTFHMTRSILTSLLTWFLSSAIIFFFQTPTIFFDFNDPFIYKNFLVSFFILPGLLSSLVILGTTSKEKLIAFLQRLKPIYFLSLLIVGVTGLMGSSKLLFPIGYFENFLCLFLIFLNGTIAANWINQQHGEERKAILTPQESKTILQINILLSLSVAILIHWVAILVTAICALICALYTGKKLKFSAHFGGNLLIGFFFTLNFSIGYLIRNSADYLFLPGNIFFMTLIFVFSSFGSLAFNNNFKGIKSLVIILSLSIPALFIPNGVLIGVLLTFNLITGAVNYWLKDPRFVTILITAEIFFFSLYLYS